MNSEDRGSQNGKIKIALICGGSGAERGISINSTRSVLDHLPNTVDIIPFYFDVFMNCYRLSKAQLYSNTPSDFDFKLKDNARKISQEEFISELKNVDLAFPIIHGIFGEDGQLQQILEDNEIPYVGGSAQAYKKGFPKDVANTILKENGFFTIPFVSVERTDLVAAKKIAEKFFKEEKLSRAMIKPALGGSSIGTYDIHNADEAVAALQDTLKIGLRVGDTFIIEPFCKGREFTSIIVESKHGEPVAFVPTEIEIVKGTELFDFRRKYLPTDSSLLHCPPRFTDEQIKEIQNGAEKIFSLFGFHDFMRVDGWILDDGRILISDINPVSGMEQCSFIFEQTSRVGFTHASILELIIGSACRRYKINSAPLEVKKSVGEKKKVFVLMGGKTAERQVSLMSGTNVWLKLSKSGNFEAVPYLMDKNGEVWKLSYSFALNRTVEEIYLNCLDATEINKRLKPYAEELYKKLDLPNGFDVKSNTPIKMTLDDFCKDAVINEAFVFIGLHGGEGEDGTIQKKLEDYGLLFNGSDSVASKLCIDKFKTGEVVNAIGDSEISSLPKQKLNLKTVNESELQKIWNEMYQNTGFDTIAVKPISDGCSSGIIRLHNFDELKRYVEIASNSANEVIPAHSFHKQDNEVNLPQDKNPIYILEPFVQVDYLRVVKNDIVYKKDQGWLEFTVGVLEQSGKYHALNPSITIAEGEVLSLEEKFQGGTGVNITPPPEDILKTEFRDKIKYGVEKVAKALGIKSYARIDIFFNLDSGKMIVIEANTLPGMTPATVIYHQALAEDPPLNPTKFIERIINEKISSNESSDECKRKIKRQLCSAAAV